MRGTCSAPRLEEVRALLLEGREVLLELGPPGEPDLGLLGGLARLQLLARRAGGRLVVSGVRELAGLAGLADVLGVGPADPPDPHRP